MHIGIIGSILDDTEYSGIQNYLLNLLKTFPAVDRVNTYTLYLKGPLKDEALASSLKDFYTFVVIKNKFFWTQVWLAKYLLVNPPDVLFCAGHTVPILRRPKLKVVATIHDLFLPWPKLLPLAWSAHLANAVIAVSKYTKETLITRLHVKPHNIHVVYEGFSSSATASTIAIEQVPRLADLNSQPFVLSLSYIVPRKNIATCLRGFKKFTELNPQSTLSYVIAGKVAKSCQYIHQLTTELGLSTRVVFLGYVSELEKAVLLRHAKAYLYASLVEGFGLPVLEAMAYKLPVICSQTSALLEVGASAVYFVDPLSEDSIASAIHEVCSNDRLRATLVERGLQNYKRFSWEATAVATCHIFEEVYEKN